MSYYEREVGNSKKADQLFEEAIAVCENLPSRKSAGFSFSYIAFSTWMLGKREEAFHQAHRARQYAEEGGNNYELIWTNFQFGVFYFDMKNYDLSMESFLRAEAYALEGRNTYALARSRTGIGGIHIAKGNLDEGKKCILTALENYRKCGHKTGESRALNDLGVISKKLGEKEKAISFLSDALAIRKKLKYVQGTITSQMELAEIYLQEKEFTIAKELLEAALKLSVESGSKVKQGNSHRLLSELYKKTGDAWKALEHLELFYKLQTEIAGAEATNRLSAIQQKFATEKADQQAEIHRLKNVELKQLNEEIAEKNKSILDSILYAKRIQESLMPTEKMIERMLDQLKRENQDV